MPYLFLRLLALFMMARYSPAPLDVDAFAAVTEPIYAEITGQQAHSVDVFWHMEGPFSFTPVNAGGCLRSVFIYAPYRGQMQAWVDLSHEITHTYQGAECWVYEAVRDGRKFVGWKVREGPLVNHENTAELTAIEVLGTLCSRGYPGSCRAYWYELYTLADMALSTRYSGRTQALYIRGVLDRLAPVVEHPALPGGGALVMDDSWRLIQRAEGKLLEKAK